MENERNCKTHLLDGEGQAGVVRRELVVAAVPCDPALLQLGQLLLTMLDDSGVSLEQLLQPLAFIC